MIKANLILILLIAGVRADASCHIHTYKKIYKINKTLDSSLIKSSDCPDETRRKFIKFLSSASGRMNKEHMGRTFKNEFGLDITFQNSIEVLDLKDIVSEALNLKNVLLTSLNGLYGNASLNLDGGETFQAKCSSCSKPGEKNIKVTIDGETVWFGASIKVKRRGYKLLRDVSPFSTELEREMLEAAYTVDEGRELFFQDLEKLKFYRANKHLLKGQTLKHSDLTPKNLVKFNQSVEVLIRGGGLSLKTKATARENGKHGDLIKLFNPKTKKNMLGKVIDFNKVVVEI